jgi:hypothetical protein
VHALNRIALALILLVAGPVAAEAAAPQPGTGPTEVRVKAFLVDVDGISSVRQSFSASLYLEYRWHEPRLASPDGRPRTILPSESRYPQFKIINAQRVWDTFEGRIHVSPLGELTLRRRLWGQFAQPLDLRDFPFDQHSFQIRIAAVASPEELRFVPDPEKPSGMSEVVSVADWGISGFRAQTLAYEPIPGEPALPGLLISFHGKRHVRHYLVKVIVPLVLIVAMSWVVFWIDPLHAASQISVAVTTMLTLIAYRFAVGSELPNIHYLTRMDEFLLGSTALVFTSLLGVAFTSSLAVRERLELARRVDRWARWIFPLVFGFLSMHALVL